MNINSYNTFVQNLEPKYLGEIEKKQFHGTLSKEDKIDLGVKLKESLGGKTRGVVGAEAKKRLLSLAEDFLSFREAHLTDRLLDAKEARKEKKHMKVDKNFSDMIDKVAARKKKDWGIY